MKKQKKIFISIIIFISFLLLNYSVFAVNILDGEIEFSQNYLEYLELSNKEKENTILPKMYDVSKKKIKVLNPLKVTRTVRSSLETKYSLRDVIPENMIIKNQGNTNACWTFSSLASLETNLALKDFKNRITTPIIYDFSESHMDYATSSKFLNDKFNKYGFARTAGSSGVVGIATAYLTNGLGAILEEEMEFKPTTEIIDISEIQNKNVVTQVNDIVTFPAYSAKDDKTQIKQQMKEHIMNYGALNASIYGANIYNGSNVYNIQTAALYCNSTIYKVDHAVAIIGWNDEYPVENFIEGNRPTNNGAWIAKNSWGSNIGDEGYIYISYEDVNVYKQLTGIINAQTEIEYENLYQYDEFGGFLKYKKSGISKMYLATEFDKKTTGKEYITQVSVNAAEPYTCKVYVNPNGTSKSMDDLQLIKLKTGESESFDAGYHTLEFAEPIKINSDDFVIVLEVQGHEVDSITAMVEMNYGEFYTDSKYANAANHVYDNVTIANSKCFITTEEGINSNEWTDTSKMYESSNGKLPNFDTTIKVFTTSKILESIEITTSPTKISYLEGEDFDKTGMVVKGNYANGDVIEITDYVLKDSTDLKLEQTSVTIEFEGKTAIQQIEVKQEKLDTEINEVSKPINSNFDDIQGNVTGIASYYFTDKTQEEYTILKINLNNIIKSTENEELRYYYYLSQNPNEENITNWTMIEKLNVLDNGFEFEINTLDISNYEELAESNLLYLYIKEVAIKNDISVESVTKSVELSVENIEIEKYVDGQKISNIESIPAEKEDNTTVEGTIPKAGKDILIIVIAIISAIIGKVAYSKYKGIKLN